ncbi:hypothetical protein HF329_28645 [Chitinophaga oryzae]|uniref:Lipoprotein n=1 Tax=Chitinophaga oryzae TaxID=2725414 RepID=A0AAE6ZKS7_9BACT|nr:hypothetical protein [Chitinophaga oryzae]QJB35061.1 hypothetical protein HF329_28645 [Chitinophaga oryzae]
MKNNIYTLVLLITAILFVACKKDKIEYKNDFNRSYRAWQEFKTSSDNSYRYKQIWGSWTGSSTEVTVTVKSGKVVHRAYVAKRLNHDTQPPKIEVYAQWEENESNLNAHSDLGVSLTLDEIYEKAREEWLKKRSDAKVYFEANNNGLISSCGFVPDNCADDCFNGIKISLIEKIQ